MAARGLVMRDLVNNGRLRKQGFFDTSGMQVNYNDVLFVDGTGKIEKLDQVLSPNGQNEVGTGNPKGQAGRVLRRRPWRRSPGGRAP